MLNQCYTPGGPQYGQKMQTPTKSPVVTRKCIDVEKDEREKEDKGEKGQVTLSGSKI